MKGAKTTGAVAAEPGGVRAQACQTNSTGHYPSRSLGRVDKALLQGLVADLVAGKNGLLFAYGITGSGKTFTMTGNPEHTGILPRTLDVLFNSLQDLLTSKCVFFPDGYNAFNVRTEAAATLARNDASRRAKANGGTQPLKTGLPRFAFLSKPGVDSPYPQREQFCMGGS